MITSPLAENQLGALCFPFVNGSQAFCQATRHCPFSCSKVVPVFMCHAYVPYIYIHTHSPRITGPGFSWTLGADGVRGSAAAADLRRGLVHGVVFVFAPRALLQQARHSAVVFPSLFPHGNSLCCISSLPSSFPQCLMRPSFLLVPRLLHSFHSLDRTFSPARVSKGSAAVPAAR